jgi:hypothetical protein
VKLLMPGRLTPLHPKRQGTVVWDAFSSATAEEISKTMTGLHLGCSPLISYLARMKISPQQFHVQPVVVW